MLARVVAVAVAAGLAVAGVVSGDPALATSMHVASTSGTTSSHYLLRHLVVRSAQFSAYSRDTDFGSDWTDADGDGCNTRYEVLIAEAVRTPRVESGCYLAGGKWFSKYDGITTTDPSTFDIDHLVPLAEVWASGARKWTKHTRLRYANDLHYGGTLIAVSAHSNRSKGDRQPQDWLPPRARYDCHYVATWVAVKWRWHLSIDSREKSFVHSKLSACGWPRVATPARATVHYKSSGGSGSTTSTSGTDPRFDTCAEAIAHGYGPYYRGVDPEYTWYRDADSDGIVCER